MNQPDNVRDLTPPQDRPRIDPDWNGNRRKSPPTNGSNRGLIATIVAVGVAVITMLGIYISGIHTQIATFQAEAAADRHALRASMDKFQAEMLRLSERQSYLEGRTDSRK